MFLFVIAALRLVIVKIKAHVWIVAWTAFCTINGTFKRFGTSINKMAAERENYKKMKQTPVIYLLPPT